ncbi:MAG: tetraether lipid synthase Tes [Phycisphaerae bacterium]
MANPVVSEQQGRQKAAALCGGAPVPGEEVRQHRQAIRRFTPLHQDLPLETQATCPSCGQVVASRFTRRGSQVVLDFHCDDCGKQSQPHHDAIWTDLQSDFPGSAEETFHGARIRPIQRRLPRTVETLCPECCAVIVGRYFVEDGAVWIEKTCPEHGYYRDCINSDVRLYSKAAWWSFEEHPGQQFPQRSGTGVCPSDCGLCNQHLSSPVLAQLDLTNRCNMNCPICFANAGAAGYVFQPDYEQVVKQLQALRDLRPIPCTAIQFAGGEPTLHPDFLKIVRTAGRMGFSHIQIATNGIRIADEKFAREAYDAGLHTLYLQFDGVGEEAHRQTRNFPGIWEKKLAAIENARRLGMKVCLVPTILKGVNDEQVKEIFRFAVKNVDVVSGISYQPVSFTGRIDEQQRLNQRYTLGHLAGDIAEASGAHPMRDMYPLSIVLPISQLLEAVTGDTKIRPSCHTDCAFGTYFFVTPDGEPIPFPRVVNVEGMFWEMNRLAARIKKRGRVTRLDYWRLLRMFKRNFMPEHAPPGLTVKKFIQSLKGMVDHRVGRGEGEKATYKTLLCAGMHFQDRYNYDVERVKRCVILYSTPDGVFPFCTYNCGPAYRPVVEKSFAERSESQ